MHSELVLHSIHDGSEEVVFATSDLIEAPNWSPCGSFLIVNGGGRIYRLDLAAPDALHLIDTGTIDACNNDHGISPDGAELAICHSPTRGTSQIYRVPITGGTPRQITQTQPSWFHGWSPDGTTLTYTAIRDGDFQILTCPADGGAEEHLTSGPGAKDGPDFTPDGTWVWFNSDHHGTTPDLWRVRRDGTDLQQMTDEATVNWFPHPSPDGAHVLYLAYGAHVTGHPRGEDVALRLMPATGGPSRLLTELHGGQGTINVPCWSPDSSSFAYMRYRRE